jgi:two-component system sensor histidine kinase GlrK
MFEPFIRGTEPRNDNVIGTGLGLSIVADCARLMHGDVQVVEVDYADVCFRVAIAQNETRPA